MTWQSYPCFGISTSITVHSIAYLRALNVYLDIPREIDQPISTLDLAMIPIPDHGIPQSPQKASHDTLSFPSVHSFILLRIFLPPQSHKARGPREHSPSHQAMREHRGSVRTTPQSGQSSQTTDEVQASHGRTLVAWANTGKLVVRSGIGDSQRP